MKNLSYHVLRTALILSCLASLAAANDEAGVTVLGTGEVPAKPTCLEIDLRAAAAAELSSDAVVKYDDSLRRIRGAFDKLDVKNLAVELRELSIAGGAEASGRAAAAQNKGAAKENIQIARSLRLVVRQIDQLSEAEVVGAVSKLLDAAKDAGAVVGNDNGASALMQAMGRGGGHEPVARFVVEQPEEPRQQAYQKAFDEATARARRLATLAKVRLGRAVSIEEVAAPVKEGGLQERMISAIYGIDTPTNNDMRLFSDKLADIPVRVTLRVRFSLLDNNADQEATPHAVP